jgi:metal-sulfur cluster biosynthetic enzyme
MSAPAETRTAVDADVWSALDTVRDPELDESIVALTFVSGVQVDGEAVRVQLRLPTYFCAPNFAYLMVSDAFDAVTGVADGRRVSITLEDHFASEEINGGVSAGAGFQGSFPGKAQEELDQLRRNFQRKAHSACLERASAQLIKKGWKVEDLGDAHLSDLPDTPQTESLLRRRADLGLPTEPDEPMFVDAHGIPVGKPDVASTLRLARVTRVSIDGNSGLCRGLLSTRYGDGTTPGTRSAVSYGRTVQ